MAAVLLLGIRACPAVFLGRVRGQHHHGGNDTRVIGGRHPFARVQNVFTFAALAAMVQSAGSDRGGFFATHPATPDRIEALKRIG